MSSEIYDLLWTEVRRREDQAYINETDMMANLYHGELPDEYDKFFPKNAPKHIIQLIRNAWDDLATSAGRLPDLRSEALDETNREEKKAGLHEGIGYKYLNDAEPSGKLLMRMNAWWLVGTGRSVMLVKPGKDRHGKGSPIITMRDPRQCYPNMRTAMGIPVELFDLLFMYPIPRREAIALGLAPELDENEMAAGPYAGDAMETKVIEFIDDVQHVVVSEHGIMQREEHNLGKVPGWVFQNFAPNSKHGISLFKNQVSLMVAVSMLVTLKLAAADKQVNPIYFAKGYQGKIKIGPNVLNKLAPNGEIGVLPPPVLQQTDRDIAQLVQFSNVLNKHPEVRQGQVDSKGAYTSAKTLEQLSEAIDTTIGDYWDITSIGMQNLFAAMYMMDEVNWPDEKKRISLNIKGKELRDVYKPSKDIAGRYDINVDYGFGTGGYQGFLQNVQANASKFKSRKSAMEEMPGVTDVEKELRQIDIESLDDAGMALLQSQAVSGTLDMMLWATIREQIAEGKPLHEVIQEMQEQSQEQAEAAAGGEQASLTAPAGPPPGSVEGADLRATPGLNPGALV